METKSTPRLNRSAMEVGEEIRVFSLARGFDRHDQRKEVQRRRNLAKAKATFNHHLSVFFSRKTKSNFSLMWKLLRIFFFPQKRYCFPNTLHEAFFVLFFLRPQAAAKCQAGECCCRAIWRMISPPHKGLMLQVCVGNPFLLSLLTIFP